MKDKNIVSASEFTVGSVLGRTNAILSKRLGLFIMLAFVTLIPSMLIRFIGDGEATKPVASLLSYFLSLLIQGAFAYSVFQVIMGNHVTFGESLTKGMSRIFPLFLASILGGIGIGLGMLLLIIPGIMLLCRWAVMTPACVVEHLGAVESLKRSAELTKGYRWKVLGITMAGTALVQFVTFATGFVMAIIMPNPDKIAVAVVLTIALSIPQAFLCVMYTTMYYDLRSVKEGITIDSLANVFD